MNRERIAWTISIILIALLAFQIPGTLAQRDDEYSFVRELVDIHRRVAANYVDPVDEQKLRGGAIDGMLDNLDPFSVYVPAQHQEEFDRMLEGSFKGVGIELNQLDNGQVEVVSPIDGSPAFKAGVLAGDIILKVNGESVEGMRRPEVIKKVQGPLGSEVKLTVRHVTGEEPELTMTREEVILPTVKGFQRKQDGAWDYYVCDDPKIAYLRITQFTPDTYEKVRDAVTGMLADGMKGLILDLRFDPGGRLDQAIQIIDLFIDKGVILSTKGTHRPESIVRATEKGTLPKFPMIVLVNEHSASASEIVAGSLMDNRRAVVVGTRTYGKGSVQEVIPLEGNGGELKLTVAYYYLPSGKCVHKRKDSTDWGVNPQIVVPMDQTAEVKMLKDRYEQELFKRPVVKSTTQSATQPTSQPSQVLDIQLQRAVDTMIALVVLNGNQIAAGPAVVVPPVEQKITTSAPVTPATAPVVAPVSAPATAPTTKP